MKRLLFVFLAVIVFFQFSFAQEKSNIKVRNSLSGAIVVTGEGGITLGQTDYADLKIDYIGKLSLEYYFPSFTSNIFSFRVTGGKGYLGGKSTSIIPNELRTAFHYVGGSFAFNFQASDNIYPFVAVGVSHMWVYPRNGNDVNIRPMFKIIALTGDIGARFMIADNLSVNASAGFMTGLEDQNDDQFDAVSRGKHKDWIISTTLGLSYYFNISKDTDGDGVFDSKDMCPETPAGVVVDEFGCPVDSDNDGIADYLDKCPNTPAGVKVDSNGCPVDSDNDGIADYLDKCPNTPAGVKVDSNGCPVDSDNDGVADYLDKCPNTPAGAKVDSNGCPVDSDGDGVADYLDKCPNTPAGTRVDKNGCPLTAKEVESLTLGADASFNSGKSDILPKAFAKLNLLAETMKTHPEYTAVINGYTDSIGKEETNMKLSEKRAQAVADYLVKQGVNRSRLEIKAFGESNPIASNKTAAGRAMNRRVEIKLINME